MTDDTVEIELYYTDAEMDCPNCARVDHRIFKNAPGVVFGVQTEDGVGPDENFEQVTVAVCSCCGNSQILVAGQQYIEKFMDEYIDYLMDNEVITEEEAEEFR